MIIFENNSQSEPFKKIRFYFNEALKLGQDSIQAVAVSSYSVTNSLVDSRFVNLKFVDNENFIFFTNYNSPKAIQFSEHKQISMLIYWSKINVQIRLSGHINKTNEDFNQNYFATRNTGKNALAISSKQSTIISSYDLIKNKYEETLKEKNLTECPDYWGGFSLKADSIEIWKGEKNRINLREKYISKNKAWVKYILSP